MRLDKSRKERWQMRLIVHKENFSKLKEYGFADPAVPGAAYELLQNEGSGQIGIIVYSKDQDYLDVKQGEMLMYASTDGASADPADFDAVFSLDVVLKMFKDGVLEMVG